MIKFKYFTYLLVIILLLELITDSLSLIRLLQIFNTVLITRFFIIIPFVFMSLVILIYLTKIKIPQYKIEVLNAIISQHAGAYTSKPATRRWVKLQITSAFF